MNHVVGQAGIELLSHSRWSAGIGDPRPIGWITVAAYAFTLLLCSIAAKREIDVARRFWYVVAVLMLALGINKQLDLQTWVTEFGRDMAMQYGWYGYRRLVQMVFIAFLFVLGLLGILSIVRWSRLADRHAVRAAFGVLLLLVFVLMRATSFHHIDRWFGLEIAESVTFNATLELTGICVVVWAACGRLWDVGPKRR